MSITDELRKWVRDGKGSLLAIADRIDAEHERQCAESWTRGHDAWAAIDRSDEMAKLGWIRLPVDADGVPIHIGDVMDKGRVTCIRDCGKGWEVILDSLYTFDTPILHHRAPTVEDVLREFTDEVWDRCCEGATASDSGIDELVAEYAAKLRLANDGEEQ